MKRSYLLCGLVASTLAACGGGGGGGSRDSGGTPPPPPAAANSAPAISTIENQSVLQDAVSNVVAFDVSDPQADAITVTAESSNPELLGEDALALAGNAGSRMLVMTPAAGVAGTAKVTLTATDSQGASSQRSFDVTVTSEQRSFREMVGSAFGKDAEAADEPIVGYSWVDTAEDDPTAFDNLLGP